MPINNFSTEYSDFALEQTKECYAEMVRLLSLHFQELPQVERDKALDLITRMDRAVRRNPFRIV